MAAGPAAALVMFVIGFNDKLDYSHERASDIVGRRCLMFPGILARLDLKIVAGMRGDVQMSPGDSHALRT